MVNRPSVLFQWCTAGQNLAQPADTLITSGWGTGAKNVGSQNVNWIFASIAGWINYHDAVIQTLYGPSNPPPAADWGSITGLPADLAYVDKAQVFTSVQIFGPTGTLDDLTGARLQATSISEGGTLLAKKYAPISGSPSYAPATGSTAYAPASGSPNYAPAVNSPNYAPATGSPSYAPASGSPNYAPATGSPAYAPSSGSQNYAPATGSTAYAPASGSANYAPPAAAQQATNSSDGALTSGQSGNTLSQNLWAPAAGTYLVNWTMLLSSPNGAMSIATYLMTLPYANQSAFTQVSHKALVAATQGLFNVVVSGTYIATLAKGDLVYIAGDNTGGETIDILAGSYISLIRLA